MEVRFATRSMQKACSSEKEIRRKLGAALAQRLQQRLTELAAADTLDDISRLPPARCHELKGNRTGQLSVDLGHPHRLVFEPDHHPIPRKDDGGLDWTNVTKVVVVEICDIHG
jgi:plasmid maintenance system killer protein